MGGDVENGIITNPVKWIMIRDVYSWGKTVYILEIRAVFESLIAYCCNLLGDNYGILVATSTKSTAINFSDSFGDNDRS